MPVKERPGTGGDGVWYRLFHYLNPGEHADRERGPPLRQRRIALDLENPRVRVEGDGSPRRGVGVVTDSQCGKGPGGSMGGDQGRQVAVGQRIPVEDQEGSALQKGRGLLDAAAGALERGLVRVRKAQAEARPVPERVPDLLAEEVQVDDDVGNPVPLEEQEIPLED